MSTPRTKTGKRYEKKPVKDGHPTGNYIAGAYSDNVARLLGQLATAWPHLEEKMGRIFGILLRMSDPFLALTAFRSIVNAQIRIKVMQTLLETSPSHATTEQFYDEVIEEFSALNKLRNGYLHGLWWTHESGKTYFEEAASESFAFLTSREVRADELEAVIKRMSELTRKIVRKQAELNQPIIEQRA